jgi:predicted O-linked N-acetylglucosamine transferase (SPINDLY family)
MANRKPPVLPRPRTQAPELARIIEQADELVAAGRREEAVQVYRKWIRDYAPPLAWAALFNVGGILMAMGDLDGAAEAYRTTMTLNPAFIQAQSNLGALYERQGRYGEAVEVWEKALRKAEAPKRPDPTMMCTLLNNLGRRAELDRDLPRAEALLTRSLGINPGQESVLYHRIGLRQRQSKWPTFEALPGLPPGDQLLATPAVALLGITDDPEVQLQAARKSVDRLKQGEQPRLSPLEGYDHDRLRVAYLSSNFGMHAVSSLTAELYELHDRARVEVWGFCWSPEENTEMRNRVVQAMDHFVPIGALGDEEAAQAIRDAEIDILVDLQGLTKGLRPDILARRPAPIQITYLGFPGTTGLPGIDYVLADRYVIPEASASDFTEKPLYLPECFQVNDRKRTATPTLSRAEYGLPEDAFVFISSNANKKITEELFDTWLRILQRAPGSVLWVTVENDVARENLRAHAKGSGVDPQRLVFAGISPLAPYFARYRAADLYLDTFPFNGGTTASEALWMGLPALTCSGRSFASRMCGSLLKAVGLPQLITHSLAEYENMAVELARNPKRIKQLKAHLARTRDTCPLFDSPATVRAMEDIFERVAVRRPRAEAPQAAATSGTRRPFLVVSPLPDGRSMTARLQHGLREALEAAGEVAHLVLVAQDGSGLFTPGGPARGAIPGLKESRNPAADFRDLIDRAIVVYPESLPGNPLSAPRVVRALQDGEGEPDPGEFLVRFNRGRAPRAGFAMELVAREPGATDTGTLPPMARQMDCTYLGEAPRFGTCFPLPGTFLVDSMTAPDRESLLVLLKHTRYLYTWDLDSILTLDALGCGAIPVEVKKIPGAPGRLRPVLGEIPAAAIRVAGINLSVEVDPEAFRTRRAEFLERHQAHLEAVPGQVRKLIEAVNLHFPS